ncbi:hypothetical protein CNBG_10111 [Cryptococcus deuterogattii R265]|uniref:uncharacterized protein n=1 Tax=Cryptococcus deuterogattii (strain R265) TaxID=294750 RepID=UPI0019381F66|nr:hypothetical protein CNBG_10111 [Cryptococcus deuterogattii R265]
MPSPLNISHNIHTQTPITKETSLSGTNVELNDVSCITLEQPQNNLDGNKPDYAEAKTESKDVEGGKCLGDDALLTGSPQDSSVHHDSVNQTRAQDAHAALKPDISLAKANVFPKVLPFHNRQGSR